MNTHAIEKGSDVEKDGLLLEEVYVAVGVFATDDASVVVGAVGNISDIAAVDELRLISMEAMFKMEKNVFAFDPGGSEMSNDREAKEQVGVIFVEMVADDKCSMNLVLAVDVKFRIPLYNSEVAHREEGNRMSAALGQLHILDGARVLIAGHWAREAWSEEKIAEIMKALCSALVIFGAGEKFIRPSTVTKNVMIFDPDGLGHGISQRRCISEYAILAGWTSKQKRYFYNKREVATSKSSEALSGNIVSFHVKFFHLSIQCDRSSDKKNLRRNPCSGMMGAVRSKRKDQPRSCVGILLRACLLLTGPYIRIC